MALVTFMSDYGWKDHYVASVKAAVIQINPNLNIIDISHDISCFDIGHAAYVLKNAYHQFPKYSVHMVCVDPVERQSPKMIAIELDEHYFIGYDSGLFSLLGHPNMRMGVELNTIKPIQTTFVARDIFAPAVANLATGKNLTDLGSPLKEFRQLFSRQLKVTKKEIVGNVIRVDSYGNLITNIDKAEFDNIQQVNNGAPFQIQVGREVFENINRSYHEVDSGDCFIVFNSANLLQIGINKGNAAELLGLRLDVPISIQFRL